MAATVWVRPLSGTWQPIGTGVDAGIRHEGLVAVSDQWGPKSLTFTLKRQARAVFPDLRVDTPVAVEVNGARVWRGRVKDTPEQSGAARTVNVECAGSQYLLDDDQLERILVHNDSTAYRDNRSLLGANLAAHVQAGQVSTDNGVITVGFPNGTALAGTDNRVGVTLDLGPANTAKRVVVTWDSSNTSAAFTLFARGNDSQSSSQLLAGGDDAFTVINNAGASGTAHGTILNARRYLHLFIFYGGGATTTTADHWFRLKTVQVFADTPYESGDASVLSAKTIITDALTRTNLATALHPDWSGIGDPTLSFPNFAPDHPMTPRELITAANAPHGWRFKVDEQLRPLYRARPTIPAIELGSWLGAEGDSGSSNSDEGIVTKVTVRGTGPDGVALRSTGTQTGTIIDRQGGVRSKTLDTSYKLNSTLADKLRDTYLASHRTSPFKGQYVAGAVAARSALTGVPVNPAYLLMLTSELARRTDLVDPDTGAVGRVATIDQVTYRDDQGQAEIDLDSTRQDFEALQERLGLLVPA